MQAHEKRSSIWKRLVIAFCLIAAAVLAVVILLHVRAVNAMQDMIYERMQTNATYYLQQINAAKENVTAAQANFFQDRQLPFIATPSSILNEYERREALLSVQERLDSLARMTGLLQSCVLYLPQSGYTITQTRIAEMTDAQRESLPAYLQGNSGALRFNGENYYMVSTGETRMSFSSNPHYVLVLAFSSTEIERLLTQLTDRTVGGAVLINEQAQAVLHSRGSMLEAEALFAALERDDAGQPLDMQRLRMDGSDYLVLVQDAGDFGFFVQYTMENSVTQWIIQSWILVALILVIMVALSAGFILYVRRIVHQPLAVLIQAFGRMRNGDLTQRIEGWDKEDEFAYLYQSFNDMEAHLNRLIDEVYIQRNLAQKAQLKQLQAQINPHFLYNSFFILSRRIRRQDMEGADELARHLGNYFKYLGRDQSDTVPLLDEVHHAQSYAAVQSARFASRMEIQFGVLPEAWNAFIVPRLILQPLLENAFKYGLENKTENGLLRVRFDEMASGLQITVEDNGEEATDASIQAMQVALEQTDAELVSGTVNIHRRLRIFFDGNAGLRITRSALGGVAMTIELPANEEVKP